MQDRSRKKKQKEKDENQLGASIVAQATRGNTVKKKEKNKAAVELGRLGGLKGGKARAKKLSAKRRKEIALKAARARWDKKKDN